MSTRAIIARSEAWRGPAWAGRFSGRYHHYDGYPSGLGATLWKLAQKGGPFGGDIPAMLRTLIDDHPAGWSAIVGADWTLPIGFSGDDGVNPLVGKQRYGPRCYCHGGRSEPASEPLTEHGQDGTEYTYVIDPRTRSMAVYFAATERLMGLVPLDGPEPDWEEIERTPDPSIWSVFAEPEQ